jgi:CHAT domain-containing protein
MPLATREVVQGALEAPTFQARARWLGRQRPSFTPKLITAFTERAHEDMRRDPRRACESARLGLRVAEALDHREGRLECLRAWAQCATLAGAYHDALRAVEGAVEITRADGDAQRTAELECISIQVLTHLERYADAREIGRRVLQHFDGRGDTKWIFRARMALAELAFRTDRPRESLRHYAKVERILPASTSRRVRGLLAANRANALQACNRFRAAWRWFGTARGHFEAEGCDHTVAQIDYNMAYSAMLRGRLEEALQRYARVESEFRRLDDERHLAHIDLDRAEIHLLLDMPEDARAFARRAAEGFAASGVGKECAQAEYFEGRAAELAGDLDAAREGSAKAEARFAALGLTPARISCLVQQAHLARRLARPAEARRIAAEAAALLDRQANPLSVSSVDLLRANLHLDRREASQALYAADAALMRCRHVHAPWLHIEANRIIGRAHAIRGQGDQAILAYRAAIDALEQYRGGVPPDEYMSSFMAARSEIYGDIVELLVLRGDTELAFEFTERAKSRALVDLLAGRDGGAAPVAPSPRRMRYLRETLNAVYRKLFRPSEEAAPALRGVGRAHQQAAELEWEIARMLRDERLADSESVSLFAVDAPALKSIQAELDAQTVLIEYFCTSNRLFTFAVTRDSISVVRQELGENEIEDCIRRFRFHLAKYERPQLICEELVMRATRDNLRKLADRLLTPIREHVTGKRLVIVPHGELHGLPYHALPWGRGWLSDAFEIVYAPSAAVFRYCARRPDRSQGPPAVFGVPDGAAPRIAEETRAVAARLGTDRLFVGADASLANLRTMASQARTLHIATHGVFNRTQPMLSAIRLADDWITLYDLYSLDIRSELVVLSTCESGTAGVTAGNEILGLSRGCLYAGAPALLCSQWRVKDGVAAEFMQAFYAHLERLPDAAAAHRAAMRDIRRTYPHPYHWAPFFLMGRPVEAAAPRTCEAAANDPNPTTPEDRESR